MIQVIDVNIFFTWKLCRYWLALTLSWRNGMTDLESVMYSTYESWIIHTSKLRVLKTITSPLLPVTNVCWCVWCTVAGNCYTSWSSAWWRHQKETFSALLTLCAGNSSVTGEFPSQRPVTRSFDFDVFFDLGWTNGWVNNRNAGDLRRLRAHYDVTVMLGHSSIRWYPVSQVLVITRSCEMCI